MLIIGCDPGGKGKYGVALLDIPNAVPTRVQMTTCDCVDEALDWIRSKACCRLPHAAGIDSFLSWSTGPSGRRPMDELLRQCYPRIWNSVLSSNSASGSMAVQGMAMAIRLRKQWPEIKINETHPKVLYFALTRRPYSFGPCMIGWLLSKLNSGTSVSIGNDHEFDALLSAWATWMGITGKWSLDLMDYPAMFAAPINVPVYSPGLIFPAGVVTYYWPD